MVHLSRLGLHATYRVHVGAAGDEVRDNMGVAVAGGRVQRRQPFFVGLVDVSVGAQAVLYELQVALQRAICGVPPCGGLGARTSAVVP